MQACDETTAGLGSVLDSGGCEGDSPSRGCRRALHLVADRREARRPQQPRDLLVRFVEQMPLGREVLLSHRRHVLPQLVAEREQPSGPQRAVYREQVAGGLVPEIQDITGGDNIDGRYLGQRGYAAVHQRQPPSLDLGQVASPGLREHFRRGIDTPYPRPAEPPERLLEADTRPGPKLGDLPGVRTVLAGLLHDPPAELGVAPGHATSDQPAERPMRTAELPGYDRHQLPPSGSRQPPVATVPIDAATSISGVKTAKATSGHAASSAVVRWCALVARRRGSGRGCAWLGLPVALGSLVRWCAAAGAAGWRGLVCAWARYRSSRR